MTIHCEEKMAKAKEFAQKIGDKTLENCMKRLQNYESLEHIPGLKVNVYSDFCKHSFYFEIERSDGSRYMNGGLILHGTGEETFSVLIDGEPNKPEWHIHT